MQEQLKLDLEMYNNNPGYSCALAEQQAMGGIAAEIQVRYDMLLKIRSILSRFDMKFREYAKERTTLCESVTPFNAAIPKLIENDPPVRRSLKNQQIKVGLSFPAPSLAKIAPLTRTIGPRGWSELGDIHCLTRQLLRLMLFSEYTGVYMPMQPDYFAIDLANKRIILIDWSMVEFINRNTPKADVQLADLATFLWDVLNKKYLPQTQDKDAQVENHPTYYHESIKAYGEKAYVDFMARLMNRGFPSIQEAYIVAKNFA